MIGASRFHSGFRGKLLAGNGMAVVLAVTMLPHAAPCAEAPKLAAAMQNNAPQIVQKLIAQKCLTVGVLKFRVHKGRGKPTDHDRINMTVAKQLEAAVVLANPSNSDSPLKVIRNASAVAATIKGASHLSPQGSDLLFSRKYPLWWGNVEVDPVAFLSGVIEVGARFDSMRIHILLSRRGKLPESLHYFDADLDGSLLHELGESFKLRSVTAEGAVDRESAPQEVSRLRSGAAAHPLKDDPQVALMIEYGGRPVEVKFENGEALIPEPREGQTVSLRLEQRRSGGVRLGAVLKVNGENVLHKERKRDIDCTFYRLDKAKGPIVVDGFQIDGKTAERFRVASIPESRSLEMYYGSDVGTISLVVFKEMVGPKPTADLSEEATDLLAIAGATFPAEPAANSEALKAQMRYAVQPSKTRGVITTGSRIRQEIQEVEDKITLDPEPIMSVVIRYYRPQQ